MKTRQYYEEGTGERREEVLLSRSEQESEYAALLDDVLKNPRKYLDNLEGLEEYKVNWKNYRLLKNGRHSG